MAVRTGQDGRSRRHAALPRGRVALGREVECSLHRIVRPKRLGGKRRWGRMRKEEWPGGFAAAMTRTSGRSSRPCTRFLAGLSTILQVRPARRAGGRGRDGVGPSRWRGLPGRASRPEVVQHRDRASILQAEIRERARPRRSGSAGTKDSRQDCPVLIDPRRLKATTKGANP